MPNYIPAQSFTKLAKATKVRPRALVHNGSGSNNLTAIQALSCLRSFTMPEGDATSPPSKRSKKDQLTPLLVFSNLAIVLEPATPTTPRNTPPTTPKTNSALLSPPSLKRRSPYRTEEFTSPPLPPRPASAPPRLVSLNQPSTPSASDNSPPWYLSRNSLAARRAGRTVTVPPPPLG